MTDPLSSTTPQPGIEPEIPEVPPLAPLRRRAERLRAWTGGRERRIAASVAAVALLAGGGLAVAAAAHEGHGERGHGHGQREAAARSEDGNGHEYGNERGAGNEHGTGNEHGKQRGHGHGEAPAPLPSFAASAALDKAQAAVPGGRAESLSRVTAQGGGAAWAVTVVGQDGVRHLVTVDGTDGQLTSNTVADGSEG